MFNSVIKSDSQTHLVDEDTLNFLKVLKVEDEALQLAVEKERDAVDSNLAAMHRLNNFRIDEMHIKEANHAEASFLVEMQEIERKWLEQRQKEEAASLKEEEEMRRMLEKLTTEFKSLKLSVRQRQEAAEKVSSVKRKLAERRVAFQARLAAIEVRQERERKALQDSHQRIVKNMSIYRTLLLQEFEDKNLEAAVNSVRQAAIEDESVDEKAALKQRKQTAMDRKDVDKIHDAKMLQVKLRMQKEGEQLREEQLLRLKHMNKMCQLELEQAEDLENLAADQKVQELELEAEQRKEMELEEERILSHNDTLKAFAVQRQLQMKAARVAAQQRAEARQLTRQHKLAAKHRERMFFENEEAIKAGASAVEENDESVSYGMSEGGGGLAASKLSSAHQSVSGRSDYSGAGTEMTDFTEAQSEDGGDAEFDKTANEGSTQLSEQVHRDRARLEDLSKKQAEAMENLRIQQRDIAAQMKKEHAEEIAKLHAEQEDEYKQLKIIQHTEMERLLKSQMLQDRLEEDHKLSNELLYGMLPRYVADTLKKGLEVEPRDFDCVTILYSDIVQFTNLTVKSKPQQIVNLLNRLYTSFDAILDDYTDVYKTETIGDAYQIVGGLNSDDRNYKKYAAEVVDCALRFVEAVEKLDMSDQVQDKLYIRVGVHSGPAVGGVAGITMPKFALFGDTVSFSAIMEQKSAPNRVHVSAQTYELVKDSFEFEARADAVLTEGGQKAQTYWLIGRKTAGTPTQSRGRKSGTKKVSLTAGQGSKMTRSSVSSR
ncbi:hypothetical protein HK104_004149 [Borealophlyctis nickersoniae]|nr:hypothetical protein HK104_004149 [Borealophlyctis nickersoniae]